MPSTFVSALALTIISFLSFIATRPSKTSLLGKYPISTNKPSAFISMILFYLLIIFSFKFLINNYQWFYSRKAIGYKLYDAFVFLSCLVIVTISAGKISAGYNNMTILKEYNNNPVQYDEMLNHVEEFKLNNPETYKTNMNTYYSSGITTGISYLQMIFNCMCAFLLFRVGYKVRPWYLTNYQ